MPSIDTVLIALIGACAAIYGVALAAKWPTHALWVVTPVMLWPTVPEVAKAAVLAVFLTGVVVGRNRMPGRPLKLCLLLIAWLLVGWFLHDPGLTVERSAARNSLIAMTLNLALIPAVAAIRPPLVSALKVLGGWGAVVAGYLLVTVDVINGRAWLMGEHNPNVMGSAAAVTLLCLAGLAMLGHKRWLFLAPIPVALFVLAQSRTALVVFAVGVLLLVTMRMATRVRLALVFIVVGTLPLWVPVVLAAQEAVFSTRTSFESQSRADALWLALTTAWENPVIGVGWRQFTDVTQSHYGVALNAHNDYALLAAEGGLLAGVLFVLVLGRSFTLPGGTDGASVLRAVLIGSLAMLAFGNVIADARAVFPLYVLVGIAWAVGSAGRSPDAGGSATATGSSRRGRAKRARVRLRA